MKRKAVKTIKKSSGKKVVKPKARKSSQEFKFSSADIEKIARSLETDTQDFGNHFRFYLENKKEGRKLTLEVYPEIPIGRQKGALITVYTPNAHLQLQFCTGYVISEMLGEVTFVGVEGKKLSGLIIEKGAACSLYANVDKKLLSGELTQLGPEIMLSGIALSLTELIFDQEK